jgi:uncharacterized protein YoxC
MAESVQVAAVVIFAILVGALLPVLFSVRTLLKRTARAVGTMERRLDDTLEKTNTILARVDLLTEGVEDGVPAVRNVVQLVNELSETLLQAQKAVRLATAVAASVGPAVAAFVRAMHSDGGSIGSEDGEPAEPAAVAVAVGPAGRPPTAG